MRQFKKFMGFAIAVIVCLEFVSCSMSESEQIQDTAKNYMIEVFKLDYQAAQKYVVPDRRKNYAENGKNMEKMKQNEPEQYKKLLEMNKNTSITWKNTKYMNADSTSAMAVMETSNDGKTTTTRLRMEKVEGKWYVGE